MTGSIVAMAFSVLFGTGLLYFFLVTRGALIANAFVPRAQDRFHVYWVYSNMRLIKFSDRKTWVAAVLLFQYDRLVDKVVSEIRRASINGKTFLMTSCSFCKAIKSHHKRNPFKSGYADDYNKMRVDKLQVLQ